MGAGREVGAVDAHNAARLARHQKAADSIKANLSNFRSAGSDASLAASIGRFYTRVHQQKTKVTQQAEMAAREKLDRLGRKWDKDFPGAAVRGLKSIGRRMQGDLRNHMMQHAEAFFPDDPDVPVWASTDAAGERVIRDRIATHAIDIRRLEDNIKAPHTRRVRGSIHIPRVLVYGRTQTLPPKAVWRNRTTVSDLIAENPDEFMAHGIRSVEDVERLAVRVPRKHLRRVMQDLGLPVPKIIRPRVEQFVPKRVQIITPHTAHFEGFPDTKGRKRLVDHLSRDVELRGYTWRASEAERAAMRQAKAGARVAPTVSAALRTISALRGRNRLAAVAGAGILAALGLGGAAAALTHRRVEKLAKAAPPDDSVYKAGEGVEDSLATRLGRAFGEWTKISGEALMNRGAALRSTLLTSIDQALRPLDTAADGGAGAPVPMVATDEAGDPRILSVSLDTGSRRVNDYARNYRLKLAGELADEQLATIQAVLNDATLNGQATEVTARLLRQTIGLTPIQAGHVISFRRQLAVLDPNVLNRALRDGRYDRTIQRALENNDPLTEDQINRMVDAYQRRYLAFRATTIARTEGLRAANNGHVEAMKDYLDSNPNFTVIKTWIATHDSRTRPDHMAIDGQQQIGLYTPFQAPSGDRMMWPHDENAPLRQQVRCRCTIAFTLVPRTAVAHGGFELAADVPVA